VEAGNLKKKSALAGRRGTREARLKRHGQTIKGVSGYKGKKREERMRSSKPKRNRGGTFYEVALRPVPHEDGEENESRGGEGNGRAKVGDIPQENERKWEKIPTGWLETQGSQKEERPWEKMIGEAAWDRRKTNLEAFVHRART